MNQSAPQCTKTPQYQGLRSYYAIRVMMVFGSFWCCHARSSAGRARKSTAARKFGLLHALMDAAIQWHGSRLLYFAWKRTWYEKRVKFCQHKNWAPIRTSMTSGFFSALYKEAFLYSRPIDQYQRMPQLSIVTAETLTQEPRSVWAQKLGSRR